MQVQNCGIYSFNITKKGQDPLYRPFLIGNQNDVKYRSIDLLAAYAICPTRQCFRFLHKAPWHASSDKIGRTFIVRPQVYSVFIVTVYS